MARTVDPARHAARRGQIIDAAMSCFAANGYDGATTAAICRLAGISSGTFFHYFPAKADVLLAILTLGTEADRQWFAAQEDRSDALEVLLDWVRRTADAAADPRIPGFIRAVGAVMTEPAVAAALEDDQAAQHGALQVWVHRARLAGSVRTDLPVHELAGWIMVLLDGYFSWLANDRTLVAPARRATLVDAAARLIC